MSWVALREADDAIDDLGEGCRVCYKYHVALKDRDGELAVSPVPGG